jgi:OCT family organic cation transporter-like MFS transporter 4/5
MGTAVVGADSEMTVVVLAMLGKFCITGTFGIIYVYSAELFPTVVRSAGVSTCSVFARIGGAVAPYVGGLGKE